jgi:hypothetical protein
MKRSNEGSKGALSSRLRISFSFRSLCSAYLGEVFRKRGQASSGDTSFAAMWLWGIDLPLTSELAAGHRPIRTQGLEHGLALTMSAVAPASFA